MRPLDSTIHQSINQSNPVSPKPAKAVDVCCRGCKDGSKVASASAGGSVKEDTKKAPEKVPPEERHKTKLEERMERDKRDLGDLRVYRRRRQGKYAQESEKEQEPPMGVIQGTYRSVQKESQKSLEKEKTNPKP